MSIPTTAGLALLLLFVVTVIPFAPTEALLIGCAVKAASGDMSLTAVIAVAAIGCVVTDMINYIAGQRVGVSAIRRMSRSSVRSAVEWIAERLSLHGQFVLVPLRWVPLGSMAGSVLAGSSRMPLPKFLGASALGSVLWSGYVAIIGYAGVGITNDPVLSLVLSFALVVALSAGTGMLIRRTQRDAETVEPDAAVLIAADAEH